MGYLARPIGGIVLSHFGDRYGRRRVFLVSLFVMSGATLGMGLVPAYAAWGAASSALMVTLRLVRASASAASCPARSPTSWKPRRAHAPYVCGVVFSCVTMGVAAATGVSVAVRTWLPADAVATVRLATGLHPRRLGGFLSFVLRRSLEESPGVRAHETARGPAAVPRSPARAILDRWRSASASLAATAGFTGLFFAHMAAYMSGVLRYDPRQAVLSQTLGVIVHAAGHSRSREAGGSW